MRNEDALHAYNTGRSAVQALERSLEFFKQEATVSKLPIATGNDIIDNKQKAEHAKAFIVEYEKLCKRYELMIDTYDDLFITSTRVDQFFDPLGTNLSQSIESLRTSIDLTKIKLKPKEDE